MTAEDFGFAKSFNMGYETFSRPLPLPRANPIYQTRQEIFYLIAIFAFVSCIGTARKAHEDALRSEVKATNRYAERKLAQDLRQFSHWRD